MFYIEFPQNRTFSHFSIDYPVQCSPEKAAMKQNFWLWYLKDFLSGAQISEPPSILRSKNFSKDNS